MASRGMRSGRTGRRRARRWIITLAVIVVVLVVLDFAARAVAQNVMASKIEQQGLSRKPSVTIGGFPFLTQVASRNFSQVNISVTDLTEGPVTITSVQAAAHGVRLKSFAFNSGTISSVSGTATISFGSLANTLTSQFGALGSVLNGAGLNLTRAGPSEVTASLPLAGSATWRLIRLSGDRLKIKLVSSTGPSSSLLGNVGSVTIVRIPKLPVGLTIDSIDVTQQGVTGRVSGHNVPFGS